MSSMKSVNRAMSSLLVGLSGRAGLEGKSWSVVGVNWVVGVLGVAREKPSGSEAMRIASLPSGARSVVKKRLVMPISLR